MKNYIKTLLAFALIFMNTTVFAFPGDIGSGTSGGGDPPAAINDYLYVLAFLGIGLFVWYNYKKTEKSL